MTKCIHSKGRSQSVSLRRCCLAPWVGSLELQSNTSCLSCPFHHSRYRLGITRGYVDVGDFLW